ncbi:MAG TPA: M50 family metallopeptidase [Candidatus Dormibacteraeota bacterium]|nr:M50 family metallopeptidase [Candidatus Dormibacteraeota bacterium]
MNGLLVVLGIAGMFLLLIAPHEGGHFLFAKLFKVRVIEFSIGAGTKLWSFTRDGTLYAIRAVPILGYVRMGGMEAGDLGDPSGFHTRPAWQRLLILAGGPAANFLLAMVVITGLDLSMLNNDPGKVVRVIPGSTAARTGVAPGDRITTVNGEPMAEGYVRQVEDANPGMPVSIGGHHANGQPFSYVILPICEKGQPCVMGITTARVITVGFALTDGATFPYVAVKNIVQGLAQLITGEIPGGILGPNGVTGPIGIADVTAQSVSLGPQTYLFFVALLSVALGFTNLLPFLALDGGRMVVVVIEALRRRPFDRAMELNFQRVGLAALLALAAVISFLDIERIATGQFPGLTR